MIHTDIIRELTIQLPYFIGCALLFAMPVGAILITLDWWLQRRRRSRLDR